MQNSVKTPWYPFLGETPAHLEYSQRTMMGAVEEIGEKYPQYIAWDFMGSATTYKAAIAQIHA